MLFGVNAIFYFVKIFNVITETIEKFNISQATVQIPFQRLICAWIAVSAAFLRKYFQLTMCKFMPACYRSRDNCNQNFSINPMFPPSVLLGILRVLGACDDN